MSKTLRLSEKWFHRGLWLVAIVFGWFLVGLGSTIVGDLPQVEVHRTLDDYLDPARAPAVKEAIRLAEINAREAQDALEQAQLGHQSAQANNRAARETFSNWLATRKATARPEQDQELIARTQQLDDLRKAEREALAGMEKQQQAALDARQARERAQRELQTLQDSARAEYQREQRAQELRVFGYRLALTLPLLVAAGWLFAKKRKTSSWPFVWGFIYFALFAFFVELVPYLPSYGGCALHRRHRAHGGGRSLCDPGTAALSGRAEAGRGATGPAAPARDGLRPGANAHGEKHLPRLRAHGGHA